MSKILVLLAAYNGDKYIAKQIESILKQTYSPEKILVSIDCSDDKSLNIVKSYQNEFPCIEILGSKVTYGSAAANFLNMLGNVDPMNFDFISLSDQDDLWEYDKLEKAIKKLKFNYDGYSSNVEAFWEDGRKKVLIKNQPQQNYDHLFESAGPGCTFVMNKKLALSLQQFLKVGQFDQLDNYHDWMIYAFARVNGFKWFIDSYSGVHYRQHAYNVFGANVGIKAFMSRVNRVLSGEGFDFAFRLMKEFKIKDQFIQSLFPMSRINLLRLAVHSKQCRRRARDQVYFLLACILLAIIFPKKLRAI